jgi:branched-chain amino acid transport system substrate-binding protein
MQTILIVIVITVVAVSGAAAYYFMGAEPAAPDKILIGASLPLTGSSSSYGEEYLRAYTIAFEAINEDGGIYVEEYGKKLPVEFIYYDDESNKDRAVDLMEHIVQVDNVHATLSSFTTGIVFAQSVVTEKYEIPLMITGGASRTIYTRGFNYIFGTASPMQGIAKTFLTWVKEETDTRELEKPWRVSCIWENTAHGEDYLAGVEDYIADNPAYFTLVFDEASAYPSSDFTGILLKLPSETDILMADLHYGDFELCHKQYTEMELYHKLVTYGIRGVEQNAIENLGEATNYLVTSVWWSDKQTDALSVEMIDRYVAKYGENPRLSHVALAYEGARCLFSAIEEAGSLDKDKIRDALAQTDMVTCLPGGRIKFDAEGQIVSPTLLVQNFPVGDTKMIYPFEKAEATAVIPIPTA